MSNKAFELFTSVPKRHNCAQAVADGTGHSDHVAELAACGGGLAPEGLCGALHSALLFVKDENRELVKKEFQSAAGALTCREIKSETKFPCAECVRVAAELVEKYKKKELLS